MYNGGFGAYPQDDMGVNSYFGESDTDFFGDTSNDSFFGEGCGVTGFGNGEFFNESVGFSTDGSEVISENAGFSTDGSNFFVEGGGFLGDAEPVPSGPRVISSKQTRAIRKANDVRNEAKSHKREAENHDAEEDREWNDVIKGVPGSHARAEQHQEKAKQLRKKADAANAYADSLRDEVRPTNWVRGKKAKTYTAPKYGDYGPLFGNPRYETGKPSKS